MKRHPALQDYSRDHHFLLLQARAIRWYFDDSHHAAPLDEVVANFKRAWKNEILPHLEEEEQILLPHYRAHEAAERSHLQKLQRDHIWLRERMRALRHHEPRSAEFRRLLREMGVRLHDHVRYEERVFFQHLQSTFSEEELLALGEKARHHREQYRPEAMGSRDETCEIP